jgi:hypothetical protein
MDSLSRSKAPALAAAASLAALLAGSGCAMDGSLLDPVLSPVVAGGGREDAATWQAYEEGFRLGRRDWERHRSPDYTRHEEAFDWSSERAFASGYRDAYEGRSHRSERGSGVWPSARAPVPEWLVGGFRGWSERSEEGVSLAVEPDGSTRLSTGGRRHSGVYEGGAIRLRSGTYAVARLRNGVRLTQLEDPRNTLVLRRVE